MNINDSFIKQFTQLFLLFQITLFCMEFHVSNEPYRDVNIHISDINQPLHVATAYALG